MEEDKYWLLISRYLSNDITLEETEELLKWIDVDPERTVLLQQLQKSLEETSVYSETHEAFDANVAWEKVSARIGTPVQKPKQQKVHYLQLVKFAAVFIILLNFGWFGFNYYNNHQLIEITNQLNLAKEVELPDGSVVWLNKGAKLSYLKGFKNFYDREVNLSGEAFFDVKPNAEKPFIIETANTATRVLGTSFNVKTNGENVAVSVFSGKVSFKELNQAKELLLLPGEEGVFNPNIGLQKTNFNDQNFMFWKDQNLDFSNEKLENVLNVISKIYEVEFKISDPELREMRITASFHKLPFTEVKNILEVILDKQIEKAGAIYVVK
jgi:transmembrane sensor